MQVGISLVWSQVVGGMKNDRCGSLDWDSAPYSSIYGGLNSADLLGELPTPMIPALAARFDAVKQAVNAGSPRELVIVDNAAQKLGIVIANHVNATAPKNFLIIFNSPALLTLFETHLRDAINAS